MKPKIKPTPRPWRLTGDVLNSENHGDIAILDIGCVDYASEEEADANAEFLLRAVNAHDALVSALETVLEYTQGDEEAATANFDSVELDGETLRARIDSLREVLARFRTRNPEREGGGLT